MSNSKARHQSPFHMKERPDGMIAVLDKEQRQRYKAPTREEARRWIEEHAARRTWQDIAGTHAAHTAGMGES